MTITEQIQKMNTANRTMEEIVELLDSNPFTIRKYLYKYKLPYIKAPGGRVKFICRHCKKQSTGGARSIYCQKPKCQAAREMASRKKKKTNEIGWKCAKCGNTDLSKKVTDLCITCVNYLDSNYGDGYVRFSG